MGLNRVTPRETHGRENHATTQRRNGEYRSRNEGYGIANREHGSQETVTARCVGQGSQLVRYGLVNRARAVIPSATADLRDPRRMRIRRRISCCPFLTPAS